MKWPHLNLPSYPLKIRDSLSQRPEVWDPLRKKYVTLTPEEYVRQRFILWLTHDKHYPAALMANEMSLSVNGLTRRADTMIANREGKPFMVIEYKAPHVVITQEVFDQAARYNMVLGAPYIVVTNGLQHYCCHIEFEGRTYHFVPRIPDWAEAMLGPIDN